MPFRRATDKYDASRLRSIVGAKGNELACHGKTRLLLKGTSLGVKEALCKTYMPCAGLAFPEKGAVQPVQACVLMGPGPTGGGGAGRARGITEKGNHHDHSGEDNTITSVQAHRIHTTGGTPGETGVSNLLMMTSKSPEGNGDGGEAVCLRQRNATFLNFIINLDRL